MYCSAWGTNVVNNKPTNFVALYSEDGGIHWWPAALPADLKPVDPSFAPLPPHEKVDNPNLPPSWPPAGPYQGGLACATRANGVLCHIELERGSASHMYDEAFVSNDGGKHWMPTK
jgi:hypothetical protein